VFNSGKKNGQGKILDLCLIEFEITAFILSIGFINNKEKPVFRSPFFFQ